MSVKFYNNTGYKPTNYPCLKLDVGSVWDGWRLGTFFTLTIYRVSIGFGVDIER